MLLQQFFNWSNFIHTFKLVALNLCTHNTEKMMYIIEFRYDGNKVI
jgi:hypothetical protein